jgi:hypothetical protein
VRLLFPIIRRHQSRLLLGSGIINISDHVNPCPFFGLNGGSVRSTNPNLRKEAITRAQQLLAGASPQFNWGRLAIALGLLIALFGGGLYSSVHHLDDWGKVFIHSFELVLGLIIGLLGGEATAQSG